MTDKAETPLKVKVRAHLTGLIFGPHGKTLIVAMSEAGDQRSLAYCHKMMRMTDKYFTVGYLQAAILASCVTNLLVAAFYLWLSLSMPGPWFVIVSLIISVAGAYALDIRTTRKHIVKLEKEWRG